MGYKPTLKPHTAQNKVEGSQFKLEVILLHKETREGGVVVWVLAARIKGVTWEEETFLHPKGHKLERSGTADVSDRFHFESSVLSHRAMTKAPHWRSELHVYEYTDIYPSANKMS